MKKRTPSRDYPRTARLNTLVQEIVAEELERIDDERLELVTVTSVVVDGDLARAVVYYDHGKGEEAEEQIQEAFGELRGRLQGAVGRQAKVKRTPELRFEPDKVIRNALRIEDVLRGLKEAEPAPTAEPSADEPTRP
ncbi:MAG: 30S ribosome-binding factor RbfA [Microthrixaceae bacterium]|nr:30S ribosome-binding factor RbfA [Acidimicrobiales bacterium]MCB9404556.1 30S ribosome-binding factor RbfA [Microthrixaceae bacterium]